MPLQLVQVLPSRRIKDRLWLIFSDSTKLPFSLDDYIKFSLKTGQEIDSQNFQKLKGTALFYLLYNYSLNQVALSPKIRQTLSPKLRQKLYFYQKKYKLSGDYSFLVEEIIDKLSSLSLLNESAFIDYLLRKNKNRSRLYLEKLFSAYHLSLPQDYSFNDQNNLQTFLIKKSHYLNLSDPSVKNKIISSLLRKGFAYSDIKSAIDEFNKNR